MPTSQPWDAPPFPQHGDDDHDTLFASIGRALTAWEDLKSFLAHLYSGISEKSLYDQKSIYVYGTFPNVRVKVSEFRSSATRYFIKYPNQEIEATLCWILQNFEGWSQRRNDVAHGVVRSIDIAKDPQVSILGASVSWCLVPPHFKEEKHFFPNSPARILTSIEINQFADAFWSILRRVFSLSLVVELPIYASQRKLVAPPTALGSRQGR